MRTVLKPFFSLSLSYIILSFLGGCALLVPDLLVSRDEITLPKAMDTVACSLKTYQNSSAKYGVRSGAVLDQAKVTFALKASADGTSTLALDTKDALPIGLTYSDRLQQIRSRDNTIELTFKNIYTVQLNKPGEARVKTQGPPINTSSDVPVSDPCSNAGPTFDPQLFRQERDSINAMRG